MSEVNSGKPSWQTHFLGQYLFLRWTGFWGCCCLNLDLWDGLDGLDFDWLGGFRIYRILGWKHYKCYPQ